MGDPSLLHYIDVQPLLKNVCEDLAVGELLATEIFNLHEAMNAIEIGDAKMDVGMRQGEVRPAAELINDGQAPISLAPADLLALLDRLMAMEITWYTGALLPQTVFTSLYVLDTDRLKGNPALHAMCVSLRSTCTLVHSAIMAGHVCDDADILLHSFGARLDLPGDKPAQAAQALLDFAIKASPSKAVACRLRFRQQALRALQLAHPPSVAGLKAAAEACDAAIRELETVQVTAVPEDAVAAAPGFIPGINSKAMGLAPPRPVTVVSMSSAIEHWKGVLESLAAGCRDLLKCTCWDDLRAFLVRFAAQKNGPLVRSVIHRAIISSLPSPPSPAAPAATADVAPKLLEESSPSTDLPSPEPAVSIKSKEKSKEKVIKPNDKEKQSLPWGPSQEMFAAEFGWDPSNPPGADAALFLEQCSIAVQGWCHTMCYNRCRQRRSLRRILLDWRNMTDHAFNAEASDEVREWFRAAGWTWKPVDEQGNPLAGPVAAWVEMEAAWTAASHLMLGTELELYAPYEFRSVYWYCDYLIACAQQAFNDLVQYKPPPHPPMSVTGSVSGTNIKKGAGAKGKKPAAAMQATKTAIEVEDRRTVMVMRLQVERMMCQGVLRMASGLMHFGMLPPPAAPLNSERERYEQRFECMTKLIRPEPLPYEDFLRSTPFEGVPADQLLLGSYEAFAKAQTGVATLAQIPGSKSVLEEHSQHLNGINRIAALNAMALKILIQAITGPATGVPPFTATWDFKVALKHSTSLFYPTLTLKSDKKKPA